MVRQVWIQQQSYMAALHNVTQNGLLDTMSHDQTNNSTSRPQSHAFMLTDVGSGAEFVVHRQHSTETLSELC